MQCIVTTSSFSCSLHLRFYPKWNLHHQAMLSHTFVRKRETLLSRKVPLQLAGKTAAASAEAAGEKSFVLGLSALMSALLAGTLSAHRIA